MNITTDEDGNVVTNKVVTYYYKKASTVIVNHIDVNTDEILSVERKSGYEGDNYSTTSKKIKSYDLVEDRLPENKDGKYALFNTETGKLDEINFYKTHNSFEIVTNAYGICGVKFIYDTSGKLKEELFISSNNQVIPIFNTLYKIHYQYDENSNLIEINYMNSSGTLINNNMGWAIKKSYCNKEQRCNHESGYASP